MAQLPSAPLQGTPRAASTPSRELPRAWRIEVFRRPAAGDPLGESLLAAARDFGLGNVASVRTGRGTLLAPGFTRSAVERIASGLLADPVVDQFEIGAPGEAPQGSAEALRVLVAPKPGVMDPLANNIERALVRTGELPSGAARAGVQSFRIVELRGAFEVQAAANFARRVLANETIEQLLVGEECLSYGSSAPVARRGRVELALLELDAVGLERLSREGHLSLTLEEMSAIQAHYRVLKREPSALELETLAQTWSEHCKHKTLGGIVRYRGREIDSLFKSTIVRATREIEARKPGFCVSVFHDNAGIIAFDRGMDLCFKVETHNHPSAIDPYGGAGTGVGGVIRDVLGAGLGARPIANTDAFFVGPPDLPREAVPKGCMHPARILRGVVAGVRDYGNCMGIPTVNGGVWFDEGYVGNPLVYCGTVGLIPHSMAHKQVHPGDLIVALGGRTGRDGIHGATFSSVELHEESEMLSSGAVQIGDPITEKRVLDCLLQARDRGLYRALTDCGAGGFSSAVGEMAAECGAQVELERVPLKYPGLSSHEVWISEAQERMVLAVPPEHLAQLESLCAEEEVGVTVIGRFNDSGMLRVSDQGELVGELDNHFLHQGLPRKRLEAIWQTPNIPDPGAPAVDDLGSLLLALLAAPNIASKAWIIRQYDHEVQGRSVLKALVGERGDGPGDAAVLQPLPDSRMGAAIACGANPRYGTLDPYAMALAAIDEALRNAVAVGADPARVAILDNFSWGNCAKPDRLGALVEACLACYAGAVAYGTPFISGKDSLNNEYRVGNESRPIPPTLLISALGIVPDVSLSTSMDLKRAGSTLFLVGRTHAELGGSHHHLLRALEGGRVPRPDLEEAPKLLAALHAAQQARLVLACHDLSEGGLAVAAAEMAFAGRLGLELELSRVPLEALPSNCDPECVALFSESCTRFLVEVAPERCAEFSRTFGALPCAQVGRVSSSQELVIFGRAGAPRARLALEDLARAHRGSFQG